MPILLSACMHTTSKYSHESGAKRLFITMCVSFFGLEHKYRCFYLRACIALMNIVIDMKRRLIDKQLSYIIYGLSFMGCHDIYSSYSER